jgi:hypothetical protein
MKITKTFVSIFLTTFLVGYVSVLPTKKALKPREISQTIPAIIPTVQTTVNPRLEMLEEVGNWFDEEDHLYKTKLLETGEGFHGEEVNAKNGEVWLGLFRENNGYFLRVTKLEIRAVYDDIVDGENKNKKTGRSVNVKGKNKPIFLLKNANKLQTGKITTLFQSLTQIDVSDSEESDTASFDKNFTQKYEIGGKIYWLKVTEAINKNGERILALILESEGKRQILHTMNVEYNSGLGVLYWAGDLDRDGKPDFFVDLYVHENVENKILFLSSEAEDNKLVKKVAYFWTTGC